MDPVAALLPTFLDPVFDMLEENLPPTLYYFIMNALSYSVALCSTAIRLIAALLAKNPDQWDLQTVLPPIMTVLAAYLALASLYRTTSWMFRLSFWFIKWGSLLGAFCVGAGWLAAVTSLNGDPKSALANLGSKAAGWVNGDTRGTTKSRTQSTRPRTQSSRNKRPWSKFNAQIRNQGTPGTQQPNLDEEAQKVMQNIVEAANQVFDANWWWQVGKVMVGQGEKTDADDSTPRQRRGQTRSR